MRRLPVLLIVLQASCATAQVSVDSSVGFGSVRHPVVSATGIVTARNSIAAEVGAQVLTDGGNAIESMIAAAATITVVYPHMNAMGGDNFWLIHTPGKDVTGIDACGGRVRPPTPVLRLVD